MTTKRRRDKTRDSYSEPESLSVMPANSKQLIAEYWDTHPNFVCPMTHCRIMLSECWRRQCVVKPQRQAYGSKKADNPFDARCRSGKCEEGLETQRKLGMTKNGSGKDASVPKPRTPQAVGQLPDPAEVGARDLPKTGNGAAKPVNQANRGTQRWVGVLRLRLERVLAVGKPSRRRDT